MFSELEPKHTIHVYALPSSPNMTMEPFGLAQDTLCVCLYVYVLSCACFVRLFMSQDKSVLFCKIVPPEICLLSLHKACSNNLRAKPVLTALLYKKLRCEPVGEKNFPFSLDGVVQPVCLYVD